METDRMKAGCCRLMLLRSNGAAEVENVLQDLPSRKEFGDTLFAHQQSMATVVNAKSVGDLRARLAGGEKVGRSAQSRRWPDDLYVEPGKSTRPKSSQPPPGPYRKYGEEGIVADDLLGDVELPPEVRGLAVKAANASLSASSHTAYNTALRKYRTCLESYGMSEMWPVDRASQITFVTWALEVQGLAPTTVRSYLSAISKMNAIRTGKPMAIDEVAVMIMKGSEHNRPARKKVCMTVQSMAVLKQRIESSKFGRAVRDLLWACATTALAGCMRMGELLQSVKKGSKQPSGGLLMKDVVRKEVVVEGRQLVIYELLIRAPKERKDGSDVTVELFGLNSPVCAVAALDRHMEWMKGRGGDQPVFVFPEGNAMTKPNFQKLLRKLLLGLPGYEDVGTHSFRRGVPTLMARAGFSQEEIMRQGRWSSQVSKVSELVAVVTFLPAQAWKKYAVGGRNERLREQLRVAERVAVAAAEEAKSRGADFWTSSSAWQQCA